MLAVIALLPPQGAWEGNIQMTAPVAGDSERRGAEVNATFKAAGNLYKTGAMEMRKIIEDNKPAEMELERACPRNE